MRSIIFALIFSFSTASGGVLAQMPIELAPDAPERHVVVPGDTLWGISARFLKDPYRWPELWKMNAEQVKNPHRIYPGQVVVLDRSGEQPQLKLGQVIKLEPQVRSEAISREIPAIPPQAIEPFLAQPLVIDPGHFDGAPRIVGTDESRVFAGNGDTIYATGIDPQVGQWQVFRPGKPLVNPDTQETLGIEAIFLGNAQPVGPVAAVTPLLITAIKQEIGRGDRLIPARRPEVMSYVPHAPATAIQGRVLGIFGGDSAGGRNSIVTLSAGKREGLEVGHVLALRRAGATVTNRFPDVADGKPQTHVLPDERYGLMFVFRVFDRVAYALVTDAAKPIAIGDRAGNP